MNKYVKYFNTHDEYEEYINSEDALLPNVSFCEDAKDVHYNPRYDQRLVAVFNTDEQLTIKICHNTALFTEIEIDGVVQPSVTQNYTFETTGDHEIKYTLVDPTTIGQLAFNECSYLIRITIPKNIRTLGNGCFYLCYNLEGLNIPSGVTTIGTTIAMNAPRFTYLTIPNTVTSIGSSAFYNQYYMTSVTIPSSVTEIGNYAFQYWSRVESIFVEATTPPTIGTAVFSGQASGRKIYVPNESLNAYKTATKWSTYANDIYPIA